jgi:uncharacterized MAPEG superfamily protein
MTLAFWCVLAAGLMPYVLTGIAKASGRRYDNRDPRRWQSALSGLPQRAHAAHLNSFEAFPLFAAAVLVAHVAGSPAGRIDQLALAFIVLRIGYAICYLADFAILRSLVWLAALACCVALFVLAV